MDIFFEILLTRELMRRAPEEWRGNVSKDEKDLVYLPKPSLSVEIKCSGQLGFKIFGNRSYGQKSSDDSSRKKEKSGYYITVNFFEKVLTLIRFGWIDAEDWIPQGAPTGQMAALKKSVYEHKLISIPGYYRLKAPVKLLDGVGQVAEKSFAELGIRTIGDLVQFSGSLSPQLLRLKERNRTFLEGCRDE